MILHGEEPYGSTDSADEARDQGETLTLIVVRTDEGLSGWADVETYPPAARAVVNGAPTGVAGFMPLAELLIGADPLDPEGIWDMLYVGTSYYGRRGVVINCMSAIDNCLWSIRAQAAGVSLAHLLGGRRRDNVVAYASTLFRSSPEANHAAALRYIDAGYRAVKFGWGGFGFDTGRDVECVAAIRDALGPERELMIDPGWYQQDGRPHEARTRDGSLRMLDSLAPYRPRWVEDFIHPDRLEDWAVAKRQSPVPIAAGEQLTTVWEFQQYLDAGCVDVIQPDLSRCGGITVARQISELAKEAGVDLVPHSWLTDLLTGYTLQFLAAAKAAPFVEHNVAQTSLTRGVASGSFRMEVDGTLSIPDSPGIGVVVDEEYVRSRRVA